MYVKIEKNNDKFREFIIDNYSSMNVLIANCQTTFFGNTLS